MGKVIWHSLDHNGTIAQYDIRFGRHVLKRIPSSLVEAQEVKEHKHESRETR